VIVAIQSNDDNLPANRLEQLAEEALAVSKKARRHSQNLAGSGFYAKKLADLRILATNEFTDLRVGSAGDTSALAELVAATFSPQTQAKRRTEAVRELIFSLRTTWRGNVATNTPASEESIFPMVLLDQTRRGYLIRIGRQINGCFQHSFFDGCAVMMRRLLEMSIIEAFEGKGLDAEIRNAAGDYFQLTDLVTATVTEPTFALSRNTKRALPRLRDSGHLSAHGRFFFSQKVDVEGIRADFRVAVEELLHISGLL
jgi:hypothetical protein